ncbi:MAG: DNA-directed RNA polymerase subunit beta', partial [Phycisphaerae bacterium]|nr:DNA-directed RNA polymerase subunit beta' [Phycisphaerae bacterium]
GGMEKEHHVPQDKQLLVHAGDMVDAGDPLVEGPLVPHDILRIRGEEALQNYLLMEVQAVYRSQNVAINDKHLEIIIRQMLRKVRIENPGDTVCLPSEVVDKFRFRAENDRLAHSVKIKDPGDSQLSVGSIVPKPEFDALVNKVEEDGGTPPTKDRKPRPAVGRTLLLGITKASLQSESFISAASFQETTKVLTEAAITGATDNLLGLKENVILGHLIPAGTAFKPYLGMRVRHLAEPVPEKYVAPVEAHEMMRQAVSAAADVAGMPSPFGGAMGISGPSATISPSATLPSEALPGTLPEAELADEQP